MSEFLLRFSSKNRQKVGVSLSHDFTTKFDIPILKKRVYGEGISDIFKSVGSKIFGKTAKKAAESATKSAATKAATITGEYAGKKAGDKIVELLSKKKTTTTSVMIEPSLPKQPSLSEPNVLTAQEVNDRVNKLLSGGKLRRRNFI